MRTLKAITATLLDPELNFKTLHEDIHHLHDMYALHTGVTAGDRNDKHIMLPSGKAISTISAAHCLLELVRTRVFIRGIYKAILDLQDRFKGEVIHILYAGCGPYATLLTPLTQVFSTKEVAFHMLDINPTSLSAAKQLYKGLNLTEYVHSYILHDATTYIIPHNRPMHLIVSETMLNALRNEPQVSIMQNLLPQLPGGGVFIPQKITVTAQITKWQNELDAIMEGTVPERIALGDIYSVGQDDYTPHAGTVVTIPEYRQGFEQLQLFTDIIVYENEILTGKDCSLNMPSTVCEVKEHSGKSISLVYRTGAKPGFEHTVL